MNNCSTAFVIWEMQLKTTVIHQFEPTIINKTITSVSENVEKLEASYIAGEI